MDRSKISGQRAYAFVREHARIREAGTPGEEQAAQAICRELAARGLTGRRESFSFPFWEITEEAFRITEPFEKEYRISGYRWSRENGEERWEGIAEAPFLYVENGDPVSLSHASGKLVMVNGPVNSELYERLVNAGAVGFLTITGTPVDEGEDRIPTSLTLRGVKSPTIPGGTIHYRDAVELLEHQAARASLCVRQRKTERFSCNIAVRIQGSDRAEEFLTLAAHYDSVPQGPGAYDNLSGAAMLLELAGYFAENPPRRTMEFVWFGAEEQGLLGSRAYVREHEAELCRHRFHMNIDLAGQLIGGTVLGVTAGEEVCTYLAELLREKELCASLKNSVWGSDSNTFAWKGIPAMTLNRDGFGMHTRYDTADLISPTALKSGAVILGEIAETLAMADEIPFLREMPEAFQKELSAYFERG